MIKSLKFLIAVGLFFWGTCAIGQEAGVALARFNEADSDANGSLSLLEFKIYVEAKLPTFKQFDLLVTRLDADQDNSISPEEFGGRRVAVKKIIANATPAPMEFVDEFNLQFSKRKPLVGDPIGDLVAFDEDGNELDFASLKGKYTVLNFGCLNPRYFHFL